MVKDKRNNKSGISYIEVIISLGILSIFGAALLGVVVHLENLANISYKRSISYNSSASMMTTITDMLRDKEDFSNLGSHNIFTLMGFSEENFDRIFRGDILNYVVYINVDGVPFTIGNTPPLGFTSMFIPLHEEGDELREVDIYIEIRTKNSNYNLINSVSRRLVLVR